jgi:ferredoxin
MPGQAKKQAHLMCPRVDKFTTLLADLYACVRPGAALVDGIVGMEGHGPANGKLREVGMLAASTDAVALDSFGAQVMGFDPMQVGTLAKCDRRALGVARPEAIAVVGPTAQELAPEGYAHPATFASNMLLRLVPEWMFRGLFHIFTSRYAGVDASACIACGECARNCPNKAISMDEETGKYRIDRALCICCYCCAEVCPVDAIDILPTLPVRMWNRVRRPLGGSSDSESS